MNLTPACAEGAPTASAATTTSRATAFGGFVGFASLFCWVLLREGYIGSDGATLYNFLPYTTLAQAGALALLGAWGLRRPGMPLPASVACACALLGSASGIAGFAAPEPLAVAPLNALSAALMGACQAGLGVFWGCQLATFGPRTAALALCGGMATAAAAVLGCLELGNGACAALGMGLPLLSGASLVALRCQRSHARKRRRARRLRRSRHPQKAPTAASVVEPKVRNSRPPQLATLVLLGGAAQASAFFAGVTAFPFALQSESVMRCWLIAVVVVVALGSLFFAARLRASLSLFMLFTLAMLFFGLFLLQSQRLDSIVGPLALMLAGRTCCVGFGWLALTAMAHARQAWALPVMAFGSLGLNGTIGCSLGVLANNWLSVSFNDVSSGASMAIVLFLGAYLALQVRREALAARKPLRPSRLEGEEPAAGQGDQGDQLVRRARRQALAEQQAQAELRQARERRDGLPAGAEALFERLGLGPEERELAAFICKGATYEQIATATNTSLRTVKYQASALYRKARTPNRRTFEQLIRNLEP